MDCKEIREMYKLMFAEYPDIVTVKDLQAMALTCKIAELRKEDKIAEEAIKRIQRTRESNHIDRENRMPLHPRPRRRRREQERE